MNFTKFGFSFSIAAVGPVALKNQTRPSRRVHAAMVRVLLPEMSVVENVVSPVLRGATCEVTAFASTGARPICPRHRLTLSASLPPSPGNVTTEMSILPPSSASSAEAGVAHGGGRHFCPVFGRCPFDLRRTRRLRRLHCHLRRCGLRLGVANCCDPFNEVAFLRLAQLSVAAHFEKERCISSRHHCGNDSAVSCRVGVVGQSCQIDDGHVA